MSWFASRGESMAIYKEDEIWYVQTNGRNEYNGKTLAEAVAGGQAIQLIAMCRREDQYDAIAAEIERYSNRLWGAGCVKCGMRTLRDDKGCVECQRYEAEVKV